MYNVNVFPAVFWSTGAFTVVTSELKSHVYSVDAIPSTFQA